MVNQANKLTEKAYKLYYKFIKTSIEQSGVENINNLLGYEERTIEQILRRGNFSAIKRLANKIMERKK